MNNPELTRARKLLEATWGVFGIQKSIQQFACEPDNDDLDATLYNLASALKVLVEAQHELAAELADALEGRS